MFYEDRCQFFIFYFILCQPFLKETVTVYFKIYFSRSSLRQVFALQEYF